MIFLTDASGVITFVNPQFTVVYGYTVDDVVGKVTPRILKSGVQSQQYYEQVWHNLLNARVAQMEVVNRSKDGRLLTIEGTANPIVDEHGIIGFVAVQRDVTERRRLEDELRHSQKMETVGQLAGGIAHDFNNLLTAILGYSQFVMDQVADHPGLASDVEEIQKAGERACHLTRQLLIFSRKQPVAPQIIDLNQIVSDLGKMLRRMIGEHVHLEILPEVSLGHIRVDPGQIEQVLMNLAVNAQDAMPKGGHLTIATANVVVDAAVARRNTDAVHGSYVSLSVTDTGSGISPELLTRVFEPFFTTKPQGKGTGLGLSTVYGIVKQSGGYITVESQPGAGTTVTSYFPRVDAPVDAKASVAHTDQKGIETILLVEDDAAVRELTHRMLQKRGYTVLEAGDVADAIRIEANHSGPIHLLLSDIVMPDLNGPDLAQRLVLRRPAMKVLYISGFERYGAIVLDFASQHAAFLQKPFTPDALALSVRELLDRRADVAPLA